MKTTQCGYRQSDHEDQIAFELACICRDLLIRSELERGEDFSPADMLLLMGGDALNFITRECRPGTAAMNGFIYGYEKDFAIFINGHGYHILPSGGDGWAVALSEIIDVKTVSEKTLLPPE